MFVFHSSVRLNAKIRHFMLSYNQKLVDWQSHKEAEQNRDKNFIITRQRQVRRDAMHSVI